MLRLSPAVSCSGRVVSVTLATALLSTLAFLTARGTAPDKPVAHLELRPGDHICLIGNTLADRMQHDGWLETRIQARFPKDRLSFRDLGYSGDELTLRLREPNFGSPDEWLTKCQADVVFAFFGYNESFAGQAGLGKFKQDLTDFIKHTRSEKYNGKSAPRLALISPIANENLHDRNLPDGTANNRRLELYTAAMADVAKANGVPFVDLFHPTLEIYPTVPKPLTVNGIHLTEEGDRVVTELIDRALFGPAPAVDAAALEKLRQAVMDKDFYWFERYRTVDGYSIYGGRADLKFVGGQTNRVVMQREMDVLDIMATNRDARVWAVAQGGDLKVTDTDTPPFVPVKTNRPGPLPGGKYLFLSGEEAIGKMTVAKGMKVELFADEKMFPEIVNPVQMAFDTQGRLWVAVWPSYPHWRPKDQMNDKLLILEDTDGDGKADKCTVFADHLHCPTGFQFYNGGVIVAQAPDLMFLKDTKGTGKADLRVRILDGVDSADTHHTSNSFVVGPGGGIFFQEGTFMHTQVETPYGPPVRNANAGVYRYEPRTQKFDVYVTFPFANPHGHAFDHWGRDVVIDGTGANPYDAALFSGHLDFPRKHARPPQVYQQRTRPCPGLAVLSSRHFPAEDQGNLLVPNVIGFQGILQYKITDNGASFTGTEVEPIVSSSDLNFRPVDVRIAPDGSLYFLDWQNPLIGHMQHNLRDPSRDHTHGRIYRIVCEGRPLLKPVPIAGQPLAKLLDVLKQPEDNVRLRARLELAARPTDEVMAALTKWVAGLNPQDLDYQHQLLEALWLHQSHNVVDLELLHKLLGSPDHRARAAATRVLCYWRDRVPDALPLLKKLAADPHPRVRLEAVRAASFFKDPEALEVPLISAEQPTDQYLDFVRGETMKALQPVWRKALAEGKPIHFTSAAGARYFMKSLSTTELLRMKRDTTVDQELLIRKGIRDEDRQSALADLGKSEGKPALRVLLDTIHGQDGSQAGDESVLFDLVRLLTSHSAADLTRMRSEIVQLATMAKRPVTRQLGFVALIVADRSVEPAWTLAQKSVGALRDLVGAMPIIRDPGERAALYPKVRPLLDNLPPALAGAAEGKEIRGRYVRIELPGKQRTLTLAEVEVFSDGRNVARQGKASQKTTAYGGVASRAIDGNTNGDFSAGGQTHTREGIANPWWQVDLGHEVPIDSIRVYNRTDGNLGDRLKGFTLKVLDAGRRVVFERHGQPAPAVRASFDVSGDAPARAVRRSAMRALTSVRGQEGPTFQALARFVIAGTDRSAAVSALLRIPAARWPKEEAQPLLTSLVAYIRKVPVADRTNQDALEALQLADGLAALLPREQALKVRKELGALGVHIVHVGTVPDQMLFDVERIVVQAGRPVEFHFENTDIMPHNFTISTPGSLEEIGNLAEATATQPDAAARNYVPPSNKILLASRLLQPRDSQRLRWTAPSQPGVYPYICTYPGHWRRMHGALYVVPDLDEYRADPEGYLAKHPLPIADELLKYSRPRKAWKLVDLEPALTQLQARSYANGKQMFTVASCVSCHQLGGTGHSFGADLTKLDPKETPRDILRDILEPSFRINEKFQTWIIETDAGTLVTGLIVEETPDVVRIVTNPLVSTKPTELKKSEIVGRKKSKTSMMPLGLLDKLTREEILDLLAFVISRGDPKSPLFQGGHDHTHAGH